MIVTSSIGHRDAFTRLRQGVQSLTYGNPLYAFTLGGRVPTALSVVPADPWPGDSAAGQQIIAGTYRFGGQTIQSEVPIWQPVGAQAGWLAAMHGFEWLRDLRAVGSDAARRQARTLVLSWIEHYAGWNGVAWAPEIMGLRLANWIGLHDFFCQSADDEFRVAVFDSMARQAKHLARVLPGGIEGAPLLLALKGLIYCGLCLPGSEGRLGQAMRLLERELPRQILPDGGHVERSPSVQLLVLRHLVDLRAALRAARREVPESLQHALDRMTPALRFFRHGDGGLALFNASQEEDPTFIDTVLSQADARGRPLKSAPHSGFERLVAGRSIVIMDTGRPSPGGLDNNAYAGTLSFEMSVGRERLIVNCGAHANPIGPWRAALAASAAHSTVTLNDTNSSEVFEEGGLGRKPARVVCERIESDGAILVEASHDGYQKTLGAIHRRRLYLSDNGEDLRGEELIDAPAGVSFAVRFHLDPAVQASIVQGGGAALLRLPGGAGWRLRAGSGTLELAESVYLGNGEEPRRTTQIVIAGETQDGLTTVKWALRREKK